MSEVVTAEQIEAFRTNGFVVVDDLLTDAELDTFEPLVTAAVAYRSAGDERTLEEPSAHRLGRATPRRISIAHTWPADMRIPRPRNCPVKGGYRCTDLQNRGGRESVTGRVSRTAHPTR
jgi:hypothetical protein